MVNTCRLFSLFIIYIPIQNIHIDWGQTKVFGEVQTRFFILTRDHYPSGWVINFSTIRLPILTQARDLDWNDALFSKRYEQLICTNIQVNDLRGIRFHDRTNNATPSTIKYHTLGTYNLLCLTDFIIKNTYQLHLSWASQFV